MASSECWPWEGYIGPTGYGQRRFGKKQRMYAHRFAYEAMVGPVPEGLEIDHLCRNRSCVNPEHLEAVTRYENQRRGTGFTAQNAVKTHCPSGHPYSPENTYMWHKQRHCRTCTRLRNRARKRQLRLRQKAA